jgi:hypothetical protein
MPTSATYRYFMVCLLMAVGSAASALPCFPSLCFSSLSITDSVSPPTACLGVIWKTEESKKGGVVITDILDGSAAQKHGLKVGDRVTHMHTKRIRCVQDASHLLHSHKPGDPLELHYLRDGKRKKTTVILGEAQFSNTAPCNLQFDGDSITVLCPNEKGEYLKISEPFDWKSQGFEWHTIPFLGITPSESHTHRGVQVEDVIPNSCAEQMAIQPGDRIVSFNGAHIHQFDQLAELVKASTPGDAIELRIERDGKIKELHGILGHRPAHEKDDFQIYHQYQGMDEEGTHRFTYELNVNEEDIEQQLEQLLTQPFETLGENPPADPFNNGSSPTQQARLEIASVDEKEYVQYIFLDSLLKTITDPISYFILPSGDEVQLSFSTANTEPSELRLFDEHGNLLLYEEHFTSSGKIERLLPFSGRSKGVYFLQLRQGDYADVKKVVKR